jgi:hypothetical protein
LDWLKVIILVQGLALGSFFGAALAKHEHQPQWREIPTIIITPTHSGWCIPTHSAERQNPDVALSRCWEPA